MRKINYTEQLIDILDECNLDVTNKIPFENEFITEDIYVRFHLGDISKPIIIAFSNAGETTTDQKLKDPDYQPWGYEFIKKEGYSVISFSCYQKNNWFRTPLTQEIIKVFSQYITPYSEKLGYGGSMGGYAVGAYCDLLNLERCLLFNPISTLNPKLVPFEDRFQGPAKNQCWEGNYHDGSQTKTPKLIVFDPFLEQDKKHAYRYQNATMISFRGVGHGIPRHLLNVGALKESFYFLINNTQPDHKFYRKIRDNKRLYNHYFNFISSHNIKQINPYRRKVIRRFQNSYINSLSKIERERLIPPQNKNIKTTEQVSLNDQDINKLRDLAVKIEKFDLEISLELMLMAKKLRPNGTFINQKVNTYQEELKKKRDG